MTKTRSIIRNVIYRYSLGVSLSDNNIELSLGKWSKMKDPASNWDMYGLGGVYNW